MNAERVLVTGIEGFTGVVLQRELEAVGYSVVGTSFNDVGIQHCILDIQSPEDCKSVIADVAPTYVIHLAGISFVQSDPVALYAANVVGTANLLEALAALPTPPKKVVLASSANVYGNREGHRLSEAEEPRPSNHYAISKLAMEKLAANYFDALPIVITRPFNYTGVGQSVQFLVPKIVSHFARLAPFIELGNIDVERDFSDVEVVANVYQRLLSCSTRSIVVNVCSGQAVSLGEIIATMEEIAGYQIDVRINPAYVRTNDIRHLTGDPTMLHTAIGPVVTKPMRATLEAMFHSMQEAARAGHKSR